MLIFFGVALMIVFLLPNLFDPGVFESGQRRPVEVVRIENTTYTDLQLNQLRDSHLGAHNFLEFLIHQAREQLGDSFRQQARLYWRLPVEQSTPEEINRMLVQRLLMAKEGEALGIVISDESIVNYLSRLTGQFVTSARELDQLARLMTDGRIDFNTFKRQIRQDLLIERTQDLLQVGYQYIPSLSRSWEIFKKLNYRVDAEVMELAVADQLPEITQVPSDRELREIFEAGRYHYPDPRQRKPGFKQPRRLAVQFYEARMDDFIEQFKNDISPEMIEAEYDRLVAARSHLVVRSTPTPGIRDFMQPEEDWFPDAPPDERDGELAPPAPPLIPPPLIPPPLTPPALSPPRPSDEPAQDGSVQDDPTQDDPTQDDPTQDDSAQDDSAQDDWAKQSIRLVSYSVGAVASDHQDQEVGDADAAGRTNDPVGDGSGVELQDADPLLLPTTVGEPGLLGQGDTLTQEDILGQGQVSGLQEDDLQLPVTDPDDDLEIIPLAEVADTIRELLAREPAKERMESVLKEIVEIELLDYSLDLQAWESYVEDPTGFETMDEPATPDFQAIADQYQLQLDSTSLMSVEEFAQSEFGRTLVSVTIVHPMFPEITQEQRVPIAQALANDINDLDLYFPRRYSSAFSDDEYIVWFTEKIPPQVRTFAEARDDVLQYWRRQRAIELTLEKARQIKEQHGTSSLREAFPGNATATGEFTWFNPVTGSFSQVYGVTGSVDDEFMEVAYSLEPGQTGVAMNSERTHAYVVRVTGRDDRSVDELRDQFFWQYESMVAAWNLNQRPSTPLMAIHQSDIQRAYNEFIQQLDEKYRVRWLSQ